MTEIGEIITTEYRPASEQELAEVFGITESSNKTDILVNPNGEYVLQKTYGNFEEHQYAGTSARRYAETERDILEHLSQHETSTKFSELESSEIIDDREGNPTLLIKMNTEYLPLNGDRSFFQSILKGDRLTRVIQAVHEMHSLGVTHGDLHLNNIGEVPGEDIYDDDSIMMIDFELGHLYSNGEVPTDGKILDLASLAGSIIQKYSSQDQERVRTRFVDIAVREYEELDRQALEDMIAFMHSKPDTRRQLQ